MVFASQKSVWSPIIGRVPFCRLRTLVSAPRRVAKAKPVIAASASPVTVQAKVELAIIASGTVVM